MALRVGVFHPGTQHSWQTALAFQESGQLAWYATSIFYDPERWPYRVERWLPGPLGARTRREFLRRYTPRLDQRLIRRLGFWEWPLTVPRRLNRMRLERALYRRAVREFGDRVVRLIEHEPVDVLWGYNTSSLEVFRWAKARGILCILDQTIGHPRAQDAIMLREQQRHPEFFSEPYLPFSAEEIERTDEELALADKVVAWSEFSKQTLVDNGCPAEKIEIVPYGADEAIFPKSRPQHAPPVGRPVDFLFAGAIHPRKGVAYLLQAFAGIPREEARLTLLGKPYIPAATFARYRDRVRHVPHVPRAEVVQHFLAADCFVFPSLFEGSAIVLREACSAALGIIQSANAGDGVRDGRNGIVLEEVSVDHVRRAVETVLADRGRLADWQAASWEIGRQLTTAHYRDIVRAKVNALKLALNSALAACLLLWTM
ncbi:MAG: glycosyltransferase family 4 protein [Rhodospirillaceae bacterium]|nr:glycosyltransferase family 4 protein [Rhodospirillaceae bacterium]